MMTFLYALAVSALGVGLVVFSYIDRIYRELGRVTTGHVHTHLESMRPRSSLTFIWNAPVRPTGFRLLANLWLVVVTAETARGVIVFVPGTWDALAQALIYVLVEVLLLSQFIPDFPSRAHDGALAGSFCNRNSRVSLDRLAIPRRTGARRFTPRAYPTTIPR